MNEDAKINISLTDTEKKTVNSKNISVDIKCQSNKMNNIFRINKKSKDSVKIISQLILESLNKKNDEIPKSKIDLVVFLDFDDTIAFKMHPDGTLESEILLQMSDPDSDFEALLKKMGECKQQINQDMIELLNCILEPLNENIQVVIITKREEDREIKDILSKYEIDIKNILCQKNIKEPKYMGGQLFTPEVGKTLTIPKGAFIEQYLHDLDEMPSNAIFVDDIISNINETKLFFEKLGTKMEKKFLYGTMDNNIWTKTN